MKTFWYLQNHDLFFRCSYIAAACAENEVALEALSIERSEFFRHWLTAMNCFNIVDTNIDVDTNNDKIITFSEAFSYTNRTTDAFTPTDRVETRLQSSNPIYYGEEVGLSRKLSEEIPEEIPEEMLVISGPQILRVGDIVTYTLSNVTEDVNVDWNHSTQLRLLYRDSTENSKSAVFCADGTDITAIDLTVSAVISRPSGNVTKTISGIDIWKSGINISNELLVGNLSPTGGYVQTISNFSGAYGYNWYNDRNWMVMSQGQYFAEFSSQLRDDNQYVTISVDFINPLGDQTIFVRTFTLN